MVVQVELDYPQTIPGGPPGTPGNLNEEQDAKLFQIREMLKAEGYTERLDDPTLLRFLRARKFDVPKAKEMFTNCEKWRKEFHVDELLENFHYHEKAKVSEYYPQFYHKTDKDGRPLYIEQLGSIDLKKMLQITTMDRMLQNLVVEYEKLALFRLPACSRKAGKLVETSCTIMDLKGVGLRSITQVYSYIQQTSVIGQNYYPERMGKFYLINAPFGFAQAWRLVKQLLDPITVSKIFILSSSYRDELLKQVPIENLPKQFGGLSDTEHVELTDIGPWVEEQYQGAEMQIEKQIEAAKKAKATSAQ